MLRNRLGQHNLVHNLLAPLPTALHKLSEDFWNAVQSLHQAHASGPEGPAAPFTQVAY